jgi:hypothetical protein
MLRQAVVVTLLLLSLIAGVRSADSLCALSSLEQQIIWADIIFVGTVDDVVCLRVPGSIVTRYRFRDVRYIKGIGPSDSLILVQDGGGYEGQIISVEHEPSFVAGKRYILPANRKHGLAPIFRAPGCSFAFNVERDSTGAAPVVSGGAYQLMMFDERHMIWVSVRPWQPRAPLPSFDRVVLGDNSLIPPPRRPLAETVRLADSADAALRITLRSTVSDRDLARDQMITVGLFPHQDAGGRVTEEQFTTVMQRISARLSRLQSTPHPEGK